MGWKRRQIDLILRRCDPSGTALLGWLAPRLDDSMLEEIAAADYRSDEAEHLRALRGVRDRGEIPAPLRWVPREVLELMRWSEPEDPEWKPGSTGVRGHLIRAFSCAVLVRAACDPETWPYITSENDTLAQLLASVRVLGREASEGALGLLAWRLQRPERLDAEERPFFALGVLVLRAALFDPDGERADREGVDLAALAEWVVREEARARRDPYVYPVSDAWLLGLTLFDQRHAVWRRLAAEVLGDPARRFPQPAATFLRGITQRLAPGAASG